VEGGIAVEAPKPPTSDDLNDRQKATTFTHQALAVRETLLGNARVRKRLLVLMLHDKVRREALAIGQEPNGTTLHAANTEGFASPALDAIHERRSSLDPFKDDFSVDEDAAYERLCGLSDKQLDGLIELLTVECLTAHAVRPTKLIARLAGELKVNVRRWWRPDASWLAQFQKIQLAHLIADLRGPAYAPSPDRKKSELVESLATLFTEAAEGKFADAALAERVNTWLPSNLRPETGDAGKA
jgi:hypothetical protein